MKICLHDDGHMTKVAAMAIYGKTLPTSSLLLWNRQVDLYETWYVASLLLPIIVCSNDDPGVTLTYFTAKSNSVTEAFLWEKGKTMAISETAAASSLKIGRYRQLIQ